MKSSHNVGVKYDMSLGSRAKALADKYPDSAVQTVSRIDIDETFLPEKFQLPPPSEDDPSEGDRYYGIL